MNQEQLMQLQMIEQEANQINQQLEVVDQNIHEMNELNKSLDELAKKENNDFLANLGKKIYIPAVIKDKMLIVDVGNKNFVKKSIPETKKIVGEQIKKLEILKLQFAERTELLQTEMQNIIMEINSSGGKSSENNEHECGNDGCECEEKCEECECEDKIKS